MEAAEMGGNSTLMKKNSSMSDPVYQMDKEEETKKLLIADFLHCPPHCPHHSVAVVARL
jgi:hypothetical protein